jgi:hypothetical protein
VRFRGNTGAASHADWTLLSGFQLGTSFASPVNKGIPEESTFMNTMVHTEKLHVSHINLHPDFFVRASLKFFEIDKPGGAKTGELNQHT